MTPSCKTLGNAAKSLLTKNLVIESEKPVQLASAGVQASTDSSAVGTAATISEELSALSEFRSPLRREWDDDDLLPLAREES